MDEALILDNVLITSPIRLELNVNLPTGYNVLIGRSGVGKTTMLEYIAGLVAHERGRVVINGRDVTSIGPEGRRVGYVPQDYALFPHLTVKDNIEFSLRIGGMPASKRQKRSSELAGYLGLSNLMDRKPSTLSAGQKQRVALARALSPEPSLLLLDEPSSAVDGMRREKVWALLKNVQREMDISVLHVTHDLQEAYALADNLLVLEDGMILQHGPPTRVLRKPLNRKVAELTGVYNVFSANIEGGKLRWGDSVVMANSGEEGDVFFCIRPEDIQLIRPDIPSRHENIFEGVVREIMQRGAITRLIIHLATGEDIVMDVPVHRFERMGIREGTKTKISLKKESIHVWKEK
ncbi:MAG: ABC transporter ATP-binding protein [Methermicoccaceae archaeon]